MTNKEIEQNYYIDISNLEIGQIFKNRKEMSERLRQPYLKGNSRVVQTNEWQRYINWETKGQQITITEIYDTPSEDIRYIKIKHKHYDTAIELLKSKGLL